MNIDTIEKFIFITDFNLIIKNKIKKLKNLSLIYLHDFYDSSKIKTLLNIRQFAKKQKISLKRFNRKKRDWFSRCVSRSLKRRSHSRKQTKTG